MCDMTLGCSTTAAFGSFDSLHPTINITANVQTNPFFIFVSLVFQIDTREYGQINSLNNKEFA
ncbi:hypothetical protein VCHA56P521_20063 [Vibrio chagasii]|nr:hypothetical protein VCHA53O469_20103 [Vibrio chagasii]CAH7370221.1 hypothetical protein VCHA56P521_20063 [Vibrio chagasii]CAH7394386.1 hypothetical protein VCHA57P526_30104 [Vibrio chagasii]